MYARLTLLEIDTVRVDMESALALFEGQVLPELREQPGYRGVLVLTTPEGKSALVSFWSTAEAAEATATAGFYTDVLERFVTIFRSPPGRARYEVAYADLPSTTSS